MLLRNNQTSQQIGTYDLSAKKHFVALKAEVDKLVINEFVNALSGLKTELKSVPIDLKKLSNVVGEEVVKYN